MPLVAQGFLAAHGLAALAAHGFLAAQGLAAFAAHGLAALAAQGLAACATVVAGVTGAELTSEFVHEAAVKARQQTAAVNIVVSSLGCITAYMVFLLPLQDPSMGRL